MLVIRLQRVGKKNQPSYRLVLAEKTAPVKGRFLEILGNYNPRLKTKAFEKERILHWISKGAQPSATVHNLLVSEKVIDKLKVKSWTPKKKEGAEKEAAGANPGLAEASPKEAAKEEKKEEAKEEKAAPAQEVKAEAGEAKPEAE